MRRRRMLGWRLARMLRRRLAHVRSRLVRALRRARRCPVRFLRRRMPHVVRDSGILRPRSGSVIRMRCALPCRRTRNIRCAGVRSRLGLVHVSRRMRRFPGRFRGRRMTRVVRNRRIVSVRSGCCVRPSPILPCWRMRNGIVGVRNIVRGGRALSFRVAGMAGVRTLWRPRHVTVVRPRIVRAVLVIRLRSSHRRIVRHGRILRCYHARSVKGRRFRGCRYLRTSMIDRCPLGAIRACHLLMLSLRRRWSKVPLSQGRFLRSIGMGFDSAMATVIADAIYSDVVHYCPVVNVVDLSHVHAIDGAVVIKISTVPVSAFIAVTVVAVTVVDATIKADLRAPVSGMPEVGVSSPSPVAGRPQKTDLGSQHPRARHPKIAIGTIGPITWSPDVTGTRAPRLFINWQRRWSDCHRDKYACK